MMKDDDFKLLKGFALGRTNGQTFAIVESLSRLKTVFNLVSFQVHPSAVDLNPADKWQTYIFGRKWNLKHNVCSCTDKEDDNNVSDPSEDESKVQTEKLINEKTENNSKSRIKLFILPL